MHLDVATLRDFYATPLGQIARRILARRIRSQWGPAPGETVASLGFGTPFLGSYRNDARSFAAFMPESQGALIWPPASPILSTLVEEGSLPVRDNAIDRLLVIHCLEVAEQVTPLLRELWRALAPQGRLLIVVPNRRGLWAHVDTTPFGYGRPYSRSQLDVLLAQSLFTPLSWTTALHLPPFDRSMLVRSATAWERIGTRMSPRFGGVLMVEARKEIVAPVNGKPARAKAFRNLVTAR
ncbi:class I SAM-dependent methyltransferase [Hyphomicrobium sp. DMF-1]|jgi:SAM-dependent methyltransferase|uniref:class I SAM-dependent methyltransferase n=1 Tax=Hyphomicrobium sp. DMF-1 TaxID=3019544 RepID=UPI0022EBF877|nr:class I SAM-dependent methyltransferase [Hyphomicrobium sp. DMF-1]WBT38845.1 class I SAM-dependent methyltransferase [Hyphomicrobium sp. DMF-1]